MSGLRVTTTTRLPGGLGRRVRACLPLILLVSTAPGWAETQAAQISLVVSRETAPAGGWVQFKVRLDAPRRVTAGGLSFDFDPTVFGPAGNMAVFSPSGDAMGYAHVSGTHVDVSFSSPSGGIGQLPGMPVLVISVPVLATAPTGGTVPVTADASGSAWNDAAGAAYSVESVPGSLQVGGHLSIQSVVPGGGLLPRGSVVRITGSALDQSTAVTIDGVSVASVQWVSTGEIDLTLGGDSDLSARRMRLTNAAGEQVEYFPALPSAPGDWQSPVLQLLLPYSTCKMASLYYSFGHPLSRQFVGLLNQTTAPVTATFFGLMGGNPLVMKTMTIPAGQLYFPSLYDIDPPPAALVVVSTPIRIMEFSQDSDFVGPPTLHRERVLLPTPVSSPVSQFLNLPPNPILWNWSPGNFPPAPVQVGLNYAADFSVAVSPVTPAWLTVTPATGTGPGTLTLTPNVTAAGPGVYPATVTVTATLAPPLSDIPPQVYQFDVALSIGAPLLEAGSGTGVFDHYSLWSWDASSSGRLPLVNTGAEFTADASTSSGGPWLSVQPAQGTTSVGHPNFVGYITITVNAAGLAAGSYSGEVAVHGSANTLRVPINLTVADHISFALAAGDSLPPVVGLGPSLSGPGGKITSIAVQTQSGGNWLQAVVSGDAFIQLGATAAGLQPGEYLGKVTAISASGQFQIPVKLTVLGPPPSGLTVTPSSLSLSAPAGQTVTGLLSINSPGGIGSFQLSTAMVGTTIGTTVGVDIAASAVPHTNGAAAIAAPATLQVVAGAPFPGTYYGAITVTWSGGSLVVPVTVNVTAAPPFSPLIATVVNAASEVPGTIAPGEILTILGQGIGPAPAGFTLDGNGRLPYDIGGTEVWINGAPAPILFASAGQVNAVVPYEVTDTPVATLQIFCNGLPSAQWGIPVSRAAPGVFTIQSTGAGQVSMLNQDNSLNGAGNPASIGTVVQIFATGFGQTVPPGRTGSISGSSGDTTALPVSVSIGGLDAPVTYHGSAPGQIAGLNQVNALVPAGVVSGPAVPIVVSVGGQNSQGGASLAVK